MAEAQQHLMFKILTTVIGAERVLADFTGDSRFLGSWYMGERFPQPPPEPLELLWDADTEGEYRPVVYGASSPVLMRADFVAALRAAGVDNFDAYRVVIHSPSGRPDNLDYLAVNVIGLVAATDRAKSEVLDDPDDGMMTVWFSKLVIDPARAAGLLFFRLAEDVSVLVVADGVVKALGSAFDVQFVAPEELAG